MGNDGHEHPGIRELDFCMFGTFLGLMTHFNNLAQEDAQYIQMPYSTLSEVDDMAAKKNTKSMFLHFYVATPVNNNLTGVLTA